MNRRSMLSMLGFGAAAGPALGEQAVKQWSTTTSPPIGYISTAGDSVPVCENPAQIVMNLKSDYAKMTGDKSAWIEDYIRRELEEVFRYGNYNSTIDPDIQAMKSFSQSAKIRMSIKRKAERRYEESKNGLLDNMKYWMEKIA